MRAVVWHGVGDVRLDDVAGPKLEDDTDAVVRITASAICGTDLHFVRGTVPGMKKGRVLGHEAVGLVDRVASGAFDPARVLTKRGPVADAIAAYEEFDRRRPGRIEVELSPRG